MSGTFTSSYAISYVRYTVISSDLSLLTSGKSHVATKSYSSGQFALFPFNIELPDYFQYGTFKFQVGLLTNALVQINCWEVSYTYN